MERLLQGDVGSGKTVVALYALLRAVESGRLGALMAPTETLAEQHFLTLEGYCSALGVSVGLLDELGREARPAACGGREHPRRHARADPGGGRPARPGRGRRGRAAPLRRRAAARPRRGPHAARPAHDRDADPADARAHRLRRPERDRDRAPTGRPQADRHRLGRRGALLRGVPPAAPPSRRGPAGVRRLPADRGVGDVRRARGRGGGRAAPPRRAPGLPRRASSRPPATRRAARADGDRSRRGSSTCSWRRP